MSTKFDVMKVADELVNNFKTMLCEYTAVKFPEWAKDNNMTAYELSADTEGDERFFGSMKESMAEDICCLLTHPDNETLQDGFILETDGASHGYIVNYRDGKSYISTYGLAADVINSIEYVLDENNIDIPDEDRTGEDGESNIYGKTYSMLLDQFSKKLISQGKTQREAHEITNKKYNYGKEANIFYQKLALKKNQSITNNTKISGAVYMDKDNWQERG